MFAPPAVEPPEAPPPEVVLRRSEGAGVLHLPSGDYPLRALTYFVSPQGRGGLALEAGAGEVKLGGADARSLGQDRWRLTIDVLQIQTLTRAKAVCVLQLEARGVYRRLSCQGVVGPEREPFRLSWRGDGRPAVDPSQAQRVR